MRSHSRPKNPWEAEHNNYRAWEEGHWAGQNTNATAIACEMGLRPGRQR
jgi:hypothetical protein